MGTLNIEERLNQLTIEEKASLCSGADFWHTEAIEYVREVGLMEGTGNGNFQPDQQLTRAQIVAILHRLAGSPDVGYMGHFQDVPTDVWYSRPVA